MTPQDFELWKVVLQAIQVFAIVVAGGVGICTYWRDSELRRMEWIHRLYERFFENDGFKRVRSLLDHGASGDLQAILRIDPDTGSVRERHEALMDYLNFFEFIAAEVKRRRLDRSEVKDMFDYYIRLLKRHDAVVSFLKPNGFEHLDAFVRKSEK